MIETIQMWIWNIGGFLFTVTWIILAIIVLWSWIINRLIGWQHKEIRENVFYFVKHKKEIQEYIKNKEGKK